MAVGVMLIIVFLALSWIMFCIMTKFVLLALGITFPWIIATLVWLAMVTLTFSLLRANIRDEGDGVI